MIAPRMRWILGVARPRIVEAQRANQRDESLQTDWARGVPSFSVETDKAFLIEKPMRKALSVGMA
jgi:hypothetical protein